ncbi:hypothetical protein KP509_28G000600 [Ceratopteris richardii]|uniref:Ternary complex factor MIP1 leucine-zipper domain-containing protein n=1 Tax=Ceratopteris richardii TaxID=49495 RepID=A0A8T2R8Y5_CERRI|nr:hypothetical protein KP509_28G000600 [Ceratopteris richardii]
MEKDSIHRASRQGLFHHDKRNVMQQVKSKSVSRHRQSEKKPQGSYQAALEEDIAKLRKQLKQEVNTHRTLERALTRTPGALPRFSPGLATERLIAEVAVLEEEVVHLEEFVTFLHQGLLHNEFLNCSTHSEQNLKGRNQLHPIHLEGQSLSRGTEADATDEKTSSFSKNHYPSITEKKNMKSIFFGVGPMDAESKQKLTKSISFRRESYQRVPTHGLCYG